VSAIGHTDVTTPSSPQAHTGTHLPYGFLWHLNTQCIVNDNNEDDCLLGRNVKKFSRLHPPSKLRKAFRFSRRRVRVLSSGTLRRVVWYSYRRLRGACCLHHQDSSKLKKLGTLMVRDLTLNFTVVVIIIIVDRTSWCDEPVYCKLQYQRTVSVLK
jgi:hypothetical protein